MKNHLVVIDAINEIKPVSFSYWVAYNEITWVSTDIK